MAVAESRNTSVLALRGIDFRRGADNSGRIVVDLPSSQVGVDIKPQGQNLVVDLLKSSLPPSLSKRFDVTDFGTPVHFYYCHTIGRQGPAGDCRTRGVGALRLPE